MADDLTDEERQLLLGNMLSPSKPRRADSTVAADRAVEAHQAKLSGKEGAGRTSAAAAVATRRGLNSSPLLRLATMALEVVRRDLG